MSFRHSSYDVLIAGGGYFGCSIALALAGEGYRVTLCESRPRLLERASYHNQARIHRGYHYPRSVLTALRSHVNFPRWVEAYQECIADDSDHYYAIARNHSRVSANQFRRFMGRVGAPLFPAPPHISAMFNPALTAQVWSVREHVFDAEKLRRMMVEQLDAAGVEVCLNTAVNRVQPNGNRIAVSTAGPDGPHQVEAQHVFNTTYSQINQLMTRSGLPGIRLKHELAEMALVTVPEPLQKCGITLMCGPFFSLMPFPAQGLHTLSHVRYTPHATWQENGSPPPAAAAFESGARPPSAFRHMQADASRYVPLLQHCQQAGSLWEIKTVLPASEHDDSRPILFQRDAGVKNFHCVMGAKIDNIFDILRECRSVTS